MLYVNENHWLFKLMFLNIKPGLLIFLQSFPHLYSIFSLLSFFNIYFIKTYKNKYICWRNVFTTNFDYIEILIRYWKVTSFRWIQEIDNCVNYIL